MGLLDTLSQIAGQAMPQGGQQNPLLEGVLGLLQQQEGGLSGLVKSFQDKGLGDIAASWVGTGDNLPVSADQIRNVLGSGKLSELAGKLGMSSDDVSGQLSQLLPQVVDKLTPGGQVDGSLDLGKASGLLSGLLRR